MSSNSESRRLKTVPVKREAEGSTDDPRGTLSKRSKQSSSLSQENLGTSNFPVSPSEFNPLDEPSPLGLRLRKSPSLLDLIQMTLSQGHSPKGSSGTHVKKEHKLSHASGVGDKLKASNFPASLLRIGTWEYKSRYEGDLVAKCYFAKHKLVWEVLDGGLKNKIEIQWSDIVALKGNYPEDEPGTLDVVLSRQPSFFRETNPQPRKHTLWQATSDFTGGQASIQRRHFLQCPQGLLGKHFEKLIQCDPRLNFLSQQGEIEINSPYFERKTSIFEDSTNHGLDLNGEEEHSFFNLHRAASPSGSLSSPRRSDQDLVGRSLEQFHRHSASPSSVIDSHTIETKTITAQKLKGILEKDNLKVPGLHTSMSMSDLVTHIEHRLSEQGTSNFTLSSEERESLEILDEIRHCLFSEPQQALAPDEKCLMSRVDSLCCLLQKEPPKSGDILARESVGESSNVFDFRQAASMSRKDSVGDLLLNLPRIASWPQFLYSISEDSQK